MNDNFLLKSGEAKNEIFGRGQHEPIIYNYLMHYQQGNLSYEQALEGMVIHLSNTKNELFNELIKLKQTSTQRLFYSNPTEQPSE